MAHGGSEDHAVSLLLAENAFRLPGAVVSDPGSQAGYPGSRLYDLFDTKEWRSNGGTKTLHVDLGDGTGGTPGPLDFDTVAILRHRGLDDNGVPSRCQYSDNDFSWTNFVSWTPLGDRALDVRHVTPGTNGAHRYWRFQFRSTDAGDACSEVILGRAVVFPRQPDWAGLQPRREERSTSEDGTRRGAQVEMLVDYHRRVDRPSWSVLDASFSRPSTQNTPDDLCTLHGWYHFHAKLGKPFVWAWSVLDNHTRGRYDDDAVYAVIDGPMNVQRLTPFFVGTTPPSGAIKELETLSLSFEGLAD